MSAEAKTLTGKKIALLIADGVNDYLLNITRHSLEAQGAETRVVALQTGKVVAAKHTSIPVDYSIRTISAHDFDALYIPGGKKSVKHLSSQKDALEFVCAMYSAGKNIAVDDEGMELLEAACLNRRLSTMNYNDLKANGIFVHTHAIPVVKHFMKAIAADYSLTSAKPIQQEKVLVPHQV